MQYVGLSAVKRKCVKIQDFFSDGETTLDDSDVKLEFLYCSFHHFWVTYMWFYHLLKILVIIISNIRILFFAMNPFITSIIAFVISPTIVLILSSTANLYQFNPLLLSCALTPKHIHQNIYTKTYTPKHIQLLRLWCLYFIHENIQWIIWNTDSLHKRSDFQK